MHFCIVGTGRCGTSLLRNIFNTHPEVFVFNETHWIVKMYEMYGTGLADVDRLIHIINSTYHITGELVTPIDAKKLASLFDPDSETTVREFCNSVGHLFARKSNKKIWADKTPDYGPFMHILQKIWPECKFIHLIRHGADVALSMSKHPGYQWLASAREDSWATVSYKKYYRSVKIKRRPIEEFSALWYRRLIRIQNESSFLTNGSYREVFFEDLVRKPQDQLNLLADFLNLSASEKWIQEAVEKIDSKRLEKNRKHENFLNEKELALLEQLGYK